MTSQLIEFAGGLIFNCAIDGPRDAPWIVCSNSLMTNLSLWEPFVRSVSDRFRVLRYDQRGHGRSSVPPPPYEMDDLVSDVQSIMDAVGIVKAHYVGISMGGSTGWGLAQRAPERLLSLTACDCGIAGRAAREWSDRLDLARARGLDALADVTLERWFTGPILANKSVVLDRVREMIVTTPFEGIVGCVNVLSTYDVSRDLEAIRLPVLLIAGSDDGSRPKTMEADSRRVPGARLHIIEGAGHLSNVEQPDAFNRIVGEFLDGLVTPNG